MDIPPKISDAPVKIAPVEVLPPLPMRSPQPPLVPAPPAHGAPIHALSALILVAVDSLWLVDEFIPIAWIVTIPLSFLAVFVPCFLIQKYLKQDSNGRALTFATLLGVLAAIPTPITGTPVGLGLLAWTGLGRLFGRPVPKG